MGEGRIADLGHAFRHGDRFHGLCAVKGIVADLRQRQSAGFRRDIQLGVFAAVIYEFAVIFRQTEMEGAVLRIHGDGVIFFPSRKFDIFAAMRTAVDVADDHLADKVKVKFGNMLAEEAEAAVDRQRIKDIAVILPLAVRKHSSPAVAHRPVG